MIAVLGGLAIWLLSLESNSWRRWGYLVGLISEPFWLYTALQYKQWGIVLLCIWYAGCYANGIRNNWKAL